MLLFAFVLVLLLLLGVAAGAYVVVFANLQGPPGKELLIVLPMLVVVMGLVGLPLLMVVMKCPSAFSPREREIYKAIGLFVVVAGALAWLMG